MYDKAVTSVETCLLAMTSSAQPLKFASGATKQSENETDTPTPSAKTPARVIGATDISSPHELTAFVSDCKCLSIDVTSFYLQVETLLEQLDAKFDEMSTQILDRSEPVNRRPRDKIHVL